jgi:hypothetical protein
VNMDRARNAAVTAMIRAPARSAIFLGSMSTIVSAGRGACPEHPDY